MMTAVMDRTLTAPDRPHPLSDSAPRPPRTAPPGSPPRRSATSAAPNSSARRIALGLLVGALTMFGVAALDTLAGATVPVLGTLAALPAPEDEQEIVEVPAPPSTPGTCLTWSRPDAADATVVDCAQPHLFEQAGSVALADQPSLPDDRQWRQLVSERCTPVVIDYLDGRYDPDGRYRVGALKPSVARWEQGDRELRCGLQSASRSGALYPITGRVVDGDQSAVQQPGTCLAIDGRTIGDPVDCAGPHAVETVGIVDLSAKFPDAVPQVSDQDAYLQPECARIANEYAGGGAVIAEKKLTVYWDNLTAASWNAGTRKVNCNLAALLPDRSGFAPVTGSVRGAVVVGDAPAPPASNTPEAGVPAPSNPPPPAAPGGAPAGPPPSDAPPADATPPGIPGVPSPDIDPVLPVPGA